MRSTILIGLMAVLLAGCERSSTVTVSSGPAPPADRVAPVPAITPVAPVPPVPPLPTSALGFVGRWAATEALCANGAWEFSQATLSTAGEVSCVFRQIKYSQSNLRASRYDIRAACTAEGAETDETFTLAPGPGKSMQAMTVRGGPWQGPIELKRCAEPRP